MLYIVDGKKRLSMSYPLSIIHLSLATGDITPTLKLRRGVMLGKYHELIAMMYSCTVILEYEVLVSPVSQKWMEIRYP